MKFIKTFENINYSDVRNLEKLIGKYVIIDYKGREGNFEICKIINILGINMEVYEYDWDDLYKGYMVNRTSKKIDNIKIINYFESSNDALKEFSILFKMKKYNL